MTDNVAAALSDCLSTASNDWMTVNNGLEKFLKKGAIPSFDCEDLGKTMQKLSEQSVSPPSFEPGTYRTKVRNTNT